MDNIIGSSFEVLSHQTENVMVSKVIDGDTIEIESGEVVRYIGIDAPEFGKSPSCYAVNSKKENEKIVKGKLVRLEQDVSEKDRYGHLLRHVWIQIGDGEELVSERLLRSGYAKMDTFAPDVKYVSDFIRAEEYARSKIAGLWEKCI